jgi:nucleoside-diphosphate kinase
VTERTLLPIGQAGPAGLAGARRYAAGPARVAPGTIRGDHALEGLENTAHRPDTPSSATRENKIFFPYLV